MVDLLEAPNCYYVASLTFYEFKYLNSITHKIICLETKRFEIKPSRPSRLNC